MAAHNTALVLVAICVQVANAWVPPAVGRIGALAARPGLSAAGRSAGFAPLKMGLEIANDGEDEDAEEGINWMPPLTMTADVEKEDGAQVFPLFPLGSVVYLPNTEHILSIFEPRYRRMPALGWPRWRACIFRQAAASTWQAITISLAMPQVSIDVQ